MPPEGGDAPGQQDGAGWQSEDPGGADFDQGESVENSAGQSVSTLRCNQFCSVRSRASLRLLDLLQNWLESSANARCVSSKPSKVSHVCGFPGLLNQHELKLGHGGGNQLSGECSGLPGLQCGDVALARAETRRSHFLLVERIVNSSRHKLNAPKRLLCYTCHSFPGQKFGLNFGLGCQ